MRPQRLIPAAETKIEFKVSNSTFIATAGPAFSVDEAKKFIKKQKDFYDDATHNVPVYIIGHPPSIIEHSNDDGEPSGTAGRPALSVLRGSGMGDIVIVITRYFGGTKLGTGGLVRAYSDAVREILKALPKAQKVATVSTQLSVPYPFFEQVQRIVSSFNGLITEKEFGVQVTLTIQFDQDIFPEFKKTLFEKSNGQITAEIFETNPNTIMPL
jgi:uncharacterized YigZ family protein